MVRNKKILNKENPLDHTRFLNVIDNRAIKEIKQICNGRFIQVKKDLVTTDEMI